MERNNQQENAPSRSLGKSKGNAATQNEKNLNLKRNTAPKKTNPTCIICNREFGSAGGMVIHKERMQKLKRAVSNVRKAEEHL